MPAQSVRSIVLEHSLSPAPTLQGVGAELRGIDNGISLTSREVSSQLARLLLKVCLVDCTACSAGGL